MLLMVKYLGKYEHVRLVTLCIFFIVGFTAIGDASTITVTFPQNSASSLTDSAIQIIDRHAKNTNVVNITEDGGAVNNDTNVTSSISSTTPSTTTSTTLQPTTTPTRPVDISCLPLNLMGEMDHLTQEEFTSKLTDSCRYDRLIKPVTTEPLTVRMQIDLTHIESSDPQQMKSYLYVQLVYKDNRLKYDTFSPRRGSIQGEEPLRNKIWVPHLTVRNERESALMGLDGADVFVQILPNGNVTYSYRMTLTFYCWMNLQKFPFDYQTCAITWTSWSYDQSNLILQWMKDNPVQIAKNLHLTEFVLDSYWTEESISHTSFDTGGLAGNYSTLTFKFKLRREIGYYIMDYFLPSIFLVVTSWVTFWLQADASAPRAVLGTSTMLSFITLNGGLTKNLPKVSYIKASEIWFLGCSTFIFCSMAEFTFVNVIWRRRKHVELKKASSKYILRGAVTPSLNRKQLRKSESSNSLYKTRSCSSLEEKSHNENQISQNNYLTVHTFPTQMPCVPIIRTPTNGHDESINMEDDADNSLSRPGKPSKQVHVTWTTMTPQEVAIWIDKRARIVFPVCFLCFNLIYWSFVYAL